MGDVDRTLLHENLKLNSEERARKHLRVLQMVQELRRAGKKLREKSGGRWPEYARRHPQPINFTLTTDLGDIDLLGEVAGGVNLTEP